MVKTVAVNSKSLLSKIPTRKVAVVSLVAVPVALLTVKLLQEKSPEVDVEARLS